VTTHPGPLGHPNVGGPHIAGAVPSPVGHSYPPPAPAVGHNQPYHQGQQYVPPVNPVYQPVTVPPPDTAAPPPSYAAAAAALPPSYSAAIAMQEIEIQETPSAPTN
jgi:hypothetical protein